MLKSLMASDVSNVLATKGTTVRSGTSKGLHHCQENQEKMGAGTGKALLRVPSTPPLPGSLPPSVSKGSIGGVVCRAPVPGPWVRK